MSSDPEEIVRPEVEGGLSAPLNVISEDALDCGCKQLKCPALAKYATRPVYVTILSLIGILQGATYSYQIITSLTVSRRFNIDHFSMDWVLGIFFLSQCVGGLAISYWGNRIHRAAWIGALVLLQSVCFLTFLIPQFSHPNKAIEEPIESNLTHLSIYADDSPEICMVEGSARIITGEKDTCYVILVIFSIAQILSGLASVAYYSLGISYLDDNTKKKNIAMYIGLIVAMNFLGVLFGAILAWSFLKIDADNFNPVASYREQIGAWWLGWPILAILLAIPGLLLAIFPKRLVSEVIEQAAGEILNNSGNSQRNYDDSTDDKNLLFLPSVIRLLKNKILMLNILSASFCAMAIYNFLLNENLYLESQFYLPRPNGLLLGFNDPTTSRAITNSLKPLIISIVIIVSGVLISKLKPRGLHLAIYSLVAISVATIIVFGLGFNNCDKKPIIGDRYNKLSLIKFCNHDCRCTSDADFRPICDYSGMFTFYSACYAGCRNANITNGIKSYDKCSCIADYTGQGNYKANEGACESDKCQSGWIIFEIFTIFVYSLLASCIVGDFLINLRSSFGEDKALVISLWMITMALLIQLPGKLIYQSFADGTCKHWGLDNRICRFHSDSYGKYLCFITAAFLLIGAVFKGLVCYYCKNLNLFNSQNEKQAGKELEEITQIQSQPLLPSETQTNVQTGDTATVETVPPSTSVSQEPVPKEPKVEKVNQVQKPNVESDVTKPCGSRTVTFSEEMRPNSIYASLPTNMKIVEDAETSSDESNVFRRDSETKISYKPLELDSDTETDLYNYGPRSRKRIPSKDEEVQLSERQRTLPNPDNYDDPRRVRGYTKMCIADTSKSTAKNVSLTKSYEVSKSQGNFNEIGIPVVDSYEDDYKRSKMSIDKINETIVMCQYDSNVNIDKKFMRSLDEVRIPPDMEKTFHILTEHLGRPPSRDQESSGFGSLQNISDNATRQSFRRHNSKESLTSKISDSTTESHSKSSAITTDL